MSLNMKQPFLMSYLEICLLVSKYMAFGGHTAWHVESWSPTRDRTHVP